MPITQQRMIEVLKEAREAHEALCALRDDLRVTIATSADALSAVSAINELLNATRVPEMQNVIRERTHFERLAGKNRRNARYMERKRRNGRDERTE